ncbi:MAG: FAD-dependent oxidoreductase [Candidatus Pelagibacterales bacterium]|nr:MAG: FAD-dependent oxidoreductase [Pelagibacterales bacterium]
MKIAVVGSGISGLSAAYNLSKKHTVDLFEKEDHFGGHANTIKIQYLKEKTIEVDIGFMVFNEKTYPNLINFFLENNIQIEKSDMSFSVSVRNSNIEYCGKGIKGIFSNKKNFFNPRFIKMFFEIISFYKKCEILNIDNVKSSTLGEYLKDIKISDYFINYHIIPMVSAIWSMPPYEASQMPLRFFLNFFKNHGLFKIRNRPQWFTVKNRSKTYVNKIINKISGECFKNYKINKIIRNTNNVKIFYGSENEFFIYDKVVLATHADNILKLIDKPLEEELSILKHFKYRNNIAVIHSDENFMPKNKKAWCSWNSSMNLNNIDKTSVTYWLNQLQNLRIDKNIFLTLNPFQEIDKNKIYKIVNFSHPYYDDNALINQKKLHLIQNKENILFCGSYFGYGFHEDGIKSSMEMIKTLND